MMGVDEAKRTTAIDCFKLHIATQRRRNYMFWMYVTPGL